MFHRGWFFFGETPGKMGGFFFNTEIPRNKMCREIKGLVGIPDRKL